MNRIDGPTLTALWAQSAAVDGDADDDEHPHHKRRGRLAGLSSRSVGGNADDWQSDADMSSIGDEEERPLVQHAEGEQSLDGGGDQDANGQRGRDTRASAVFSGARKKWAGRILESSQERRVATAFQSLLKASETGPMVSGGTPSALRHAVISKLRRLAMRLGEDRSKGERSAALHLLTGTEWFQVRQLGLRPGMREVADALQGLAPVFSHQGTHHAVLLPLLLLRTLAPGYPAKDAVASATVQSMGRWRGSTKKGPLT